jgi:GDP-4-dehydro-6-deoxy-D-mannose reductase
MTGNCHSVVRSLGQSVTRRRDIVAPMRVLITGGTGFAGRPLAELCRAEGDEVTALGSAHADLTDAAATDRAVEQAQPERVFHLAARASVGDSWGDPRGTLDANVASTFNVLDAVRRLAPGARVLVAGSGEVYGPVPPERQPITETEPFRPQNPYAVSKAATDVLAGFFADAHGLHVVRTRAFNHAGPGQDDRYVVAAFAKQIAEAEARGEASLELLTGDLRPRRDFTDVRDVARAYRLALEQAPPGVYNVARGEATSIADILSALARQARLEVQQRTDPERLRATEVMEIRGSHEQLTAATGWRPEIALERTLGDALDGWRARTGERATR